MKTDAQFKSLGVTWDGVDGQATFTPGTVFHRLTVIREAPSYGHDRAYECDCECGTKGYRARHHDLARDKVKSCGCLMAERNRKLEVAHGGNDADRWGMVEIPTRAPDLSDVTVPWRADVLVERRVVEMRRVRDGSLADRRAMEGAS